MLDLVLTAEQIRQIESEGCETYPNECCGILYGHDISNRRVVRRLESVANDFEAGEQYHRFSISAKQLMDAEKAAGEAGELVLGFYHSHPDHPAEPSEYDRSHAWPFYSYVIVAIERGKSARLTSWLLDEQTEQFGAQAIREAT